MFLPPAVMMMSFLRPVMKVKPRSPIRPRSPVLIEPSGSHRLCGEFGLLVVAKEHVRAGQLNFIVFAKTHAHARPRLADRTDLVVVLPIDEHRSGGFGHAITLDEGDVIHAVEKVGQIHVERRTTAGQPFEVRSESGTNGFAYRGHVERMAHALDERMAAAGLLILAPLDEVLDRLGDRYAPGCRHQPSARPRYTPSRTHVAHPAGRWA